MGYVTRSQFRQCLSYLGLDSSEEEMRVMEAKFFDSKGFNYLRFLEEPSEELEDKYQLRMTQLTAKKEQVYSFRFGEELVMPKLMTLFTLLSDTRNPEDLGAH